jgi:hypothetical protein
MFGRKPKPVAKAEEPKMEGEATGIYRITMETMNENLKQKKAARSTAERLIHSVDFLKQKGVPFERRFKKR